MSRSRYSPQQQAYYRFYLQSAQWKRVKERRLRQAGYRCEFALEHGGVRCPRRRYLSVHHNTYERLGRELDSDLDVLCWFHHTLVHLLQKCCTFCRRPCLLTDEAAEIWLNAVLFNVGIHLDTGPVNWRKLPTKEYFLAEIPHTCKDCRDYIRGGDHDDA